MGAGAAMSTKTFSNATSSVSTFSGSKTAGLTDTDSLPAPGISATEIADELETTLEQFSKIAARLNSAH